MTIYKIRDKATGKFLAKRGSSLKGKTFNQKNHVSTTLGGTARAITRTDIEIVEFELVEKQVHEPKDFFTEKKTKVVETKTETV